MIKLTEEGIVDTISGLSIVSNLNFIRTLSEIEIDKLIEDIKIEGIRYAVCGDKKAHCLTNKMVIKCPADYYDDWGDVPQSAK